MTRTHLEGPQAFVSPSQIEVIEDVLVSALAWAVLWPRWDGGNVFPNAVENPAQTRVLLLQAQLNPAPCVAGSEGRCGPSALRGLPRQLWTPAADRRSSRRTGGL